MSEQLVKTVEAEIDTATEITDLASAAPKGKYLSFTVVDGYLRGDHKCRYELHATGCRDLRKAQRTLPSFEVLGLEQQRHDDCLDGVLGQAIEDLNNQPTRKDFWVQPCCQLKRMRAIGRA